MEVSALKHAGVAGIHGRSPLLRLQSDERLIALVRRGNHGAFEALVSRYQARLLAFCRHMLGSREDAEDVLQEVFAAAFNAILADDRPINARPWLYRIARNRSLNHLRRVQPIGVDSMDVHFSEHGTSTADKVEDREQFRELIADVQDLPETQRSALLLREIDALSYEQIAEAMETTIPSVKSLLVRARVSLAEAAEARQLSCEEVRIELGEIAEGLRRRASAPVRRHLRTCDRCSAFRVQLRSTNKALAAVMPVGALFVARKLFLAHLGWSASAGGHAGSAAAGGAAAAAGGAAAGSATSTFISTGLGVVATKAAAGIAAAALVTAGAVEIEHTKPPVHHHARAIARTGSPGPRALPAPAPAPHPSAVIQQAPARVQRALEASLPAHAAKQAGTPAPRHPAHASASAALGRREHASLTTTTPSSAKADADARSSTATTPADTTATAPPAGQTQVESSTTTLPSTLPPTATPAGTTPTPPPATTPVTTPPPPPVTTPTDPSGPPATTPTDPPPVTTPTDPTTPPTTTPTDPPPVTTPTDPSSTPPATTPQDTPPATTDTTATPAP